MSESDGDHVEVEPRPAATALPGPASRLPHTHAEWRALLTSLDIRPSKGMGQNFLFERGIVDRMARASGVGRQDRVLEVGPGLGILTEALLGVAGNVTAIEYDRRLAAHLRAALGDNPRFRLVEADALTVPSADLFPDREPFAVVANLPYSVGSAELQHLLDQPRRPFRLVVMVQREVAERFVAPPGELSVLGVAVQFYTEPKILFDVRPDVFIPPPKVTSSVVRLDVRPELPLSEDQIPEFFRIVRAGFNQKRKQVANSIAARFGLERSDVAHWLERAGVDPEHRAQTLTVAQWVEIARNAPALPALDTSQSRRRDRRAAGTSPSS